jgi:hypothetical protein
VNHLRFSLGQQNHVFGVGHADGSSIGEGLKKQQELAAISPNLPVVNSLDTLAKPFEAVRAAEHAPRACPEGMNDQVISPSVKDDDAPNLGM